MTKKNRKGKDYLGEGCQEKVGWLVGPWFGRSGATVPSTNSQHLFHYIPMNISNTLWKWAPRLMTINPTDSRPSILGNDQRGREGGRVFGWMVLWEPHRNHISNVSVSSLNIPSLLSFLFFALFFFLYFLSISRSSHLAINWLLLITCKTLVTHLFAKWPIVNWNGRGEKKNPWKNWHHSIIWEMDDNLSMNVI